MSEALPLSLIKALVVDDHDPIRKAMKRILLAMGIREVVECFDGTEAIKELSRQTDINLVLCDIYMRKVSGFDVLSQVRNRSIASDIPFLIVTGESNKDDIVKASDLGADDYLIKPFQAETMTTKVKNVLTKFFLPTPLLKALRNADRLMMTHQYAEALEQYEKALKEDPNSKRAAHARALALHKTGKIKEAIKVLIHNTRESPSFYKNFASLANIYLQAGDTEQGITAMQKELELNPKQSHRQVELGNLLFKREDVHGAMGHFREALKDNAKLKGALFGMGRALAKTGDFEKALYYFKRMRRHYPTDSRPLKEIVSLCLGEGKDRMAEVFLLDERNAHPDRADAYIYLAKYYVTVQNPTRAKEILSQLLERQPENQEALMTLSSLQIKTNDLQGAVINLERAIKNEATFGAVLALAQCEIKLNQFAKATTSLHQALKMTPHDPQALMYLAFCFQKMNEPHKAVFGYALAIKSGANKERCQKGLKACYEIIHESRRRAWPQSAA